MMNIKSRLKIKSKGDALFNRLETIDAVERKDDHLSFFYKERRQPSNDAMRER